MKSALLLLATLFCQEVFAQPSISVATNFSVLRNFTPREKFWVAGQNVQASLNFTPTESGYASLEYFTEGTFRNRLAAQAKSPLSLPQSFQYTATGRMVFRQLSIGWKHYFRGGSAATSGVNIYGLAGFGYLFSRIRNSIDLSVDTAAYTSAVYVGQGQVRRLSFDAGGGAELHLGGPIYTFATLRTWLPASYHPSGYLPDSDRMPLALIGGVGVRILFDSGY